MVDLVSLYTNTVYEVFRKKHDTQTTLTINAATKCQHLILNVIWLSIRIVSQQLFYPPKISYGMSELNPKAVYHYIIWPVLVSGGVWDKKQNNNHFHCKM